MPAKSKKAKATDQEQVNEWMQKLDPEMKPAIDAVRKIIKTAGPTLNERIKWNAPSYYYKEDIVTFGPARSKHAMIFISRYLVADNFFGQGCSTSYCLTNIP